MTITTDRRIWDQLRTKLNDKEFLDQFDGMLFDVALELENKLVKQSTVFDYEFLQQWHIEDKHLSYRLVNRKHYQPFVEFGTKPHFPPVEAIETWVKYKQQMGRFSRQFTANEIQWFICKKIAEHGTKGKFIVKKVLDEYEETLNQGLLDFIKDYFQEV